MDRISKRIELLKKFQDEMDRRIQIEEEAYQLICQGRYEESNKLLKNLDDSIIQKLGRQLDEFPEENSNHPVQESLEENTELLNKDVTVENDMYFHYDLKMPDGKNLFSIAIIMKELQLGGNEFEKIKNKFDHLKARLSQNGVLDEVIEFQDSEGILKTEAVLMSSEKDVEKGRVRISISVEVNIPAILLDKIKECMTEFIQSICSLLPAQ